MAKQDAKPQTRTETIFTTPEAARKLRVSDATIRHMVHDNRLEAFRIGRRFRITETSLTEFIRQQEGR